MTETKNYNLNQWNAADPVRREDFNSDNAKLDAALAKQAQALSAHAAAIAQCGNCKLHYTTYTGTGTYGSFHPTTLTFPGYPALVFLFSLESGYFIAARISERAIYFCNSMSYKLITWTGNTLSWSDPESASRQFNASGKIYSVVALLDSEK